MNSIFFDKDNNSSLELASFVITFLCAMSIINTGFDFTINSVDDIIKLGMSIAPLVTIIYYILMIIKRISGYRMERKNKKQEQYNLELDHSIKTSSLNRILLENEYKLQEKIRLEIDNERKKLENERRKLEVSILEKEEKLLQKQLKNEDYGT